MARASGVLPIFLSALFASRTSFSEETPAPATGAPTAQAGVTPSEIVVRAREALEDQRYDDALAGVLPLLASSPRWQAPALEITAVALLILGRTTDAKVALDKLYELEPAFVLEDPSLPPRVTSAFDTEASRAHARAVLVQLRTDPVDRQGFDVVAGGDTASVHLACRRDALDPFVPLPTTQRGDLYHFRLPTGRTYQCYAVALDKDDLALGRLGREGAPFNAVPRARPTEPPVYKRWYFWAIMVGAAATTGVTVGVVVQRSQNSPPAPSSDITIHWQPTVYSW